MAKTQIINLPCYKYSRAVVTETGHCDLLRELMEGGPKNYTQNFGLIYEVETM